MGIREAVQPAFQLCWGTVRKNVDLMPDTGLNFKPEGLETRSFREVALHMANSCATFGENIGKTAWERIAAFPPETHVSKAQVLAALTQAGDRFASGLSRLTDEEAGRVVRTPWGMELPQGQLEGRSSSRPASSRPTSAARSPTGFTNFTPASPASSRRAIRRPSRWRMCSPTPGFPARPSSWGTSAG